MEQRKVKVRIPINREEDRATVAGILAKNMIQVTPVKAYKTTASGKKSTAMQYCLVIEVEEHNDKDV